MIILDGKATAATIRVETQLEVAAKMKRAGRAPGLAVVLVGEDPASQVYVRNKGRACEEVGINSIIHTLPATTSTDELLELIDSMNADPAIDGILVQLPLPKNIDSRRCLNRILPDKDVDGFHPENMGKLMLGMPGFVPCTPAGVMTLLRRYNLSPAGKKAVVVGRSNIVGKPLALLLGAPTPEGNATVTVCHSATPDLAEVCRQADFLFLAMGSPRCITMDMVKPGAVVVDVGINKTEDGLVGDCDYTGISRVVAAITPVPGGIGPMTIAQLLRNTVKAFEQHTGV